MHSAKAHLYIPVLIAAMFFAAVFTPVDVLGCRTRGLLALVISLSSGIAGIGTGIIGIRKRGRGEADAARWMVITAVLTIPVIGLIILM